MKLVLYVEKGRGFVVVEVRLEFTCTKIGRVSYELFLAKLCTMAANATMNPEAACTYARSHNRALSGFQRPSRHIGIGLQGSFDAAVEMI